MGIAECTWWPCTAIACSDGGVWQDNALHLWPKYVHTRLATEFAWLQSRRKYIYIRRSTKYLYLQSKIYTVIVIYRTSRVAIFKLFHHHPFNIKSHYKFDYHELTPQLRYSGQNVYWTQTQLLLQLKICASKYTSNYQQNSVVSLITTCLPDD
jgi:hypothetical protein